MYMGGTMYKQSCSRCGKTMNVSPSKSRFMEDMYKNTIYSGDRNLFEENARNASKKLTESGFVYINETINASADLGGSIYDAVATDGKFGSVHPSQKGLETAEWQLLIATMLANADRPTTNDAAVDDFNEIVSLLDQLKDFGIDTAQKTMGISDIPDELEKLNRQIPKIKEQIAHLSGIEKQNAENAINKLSSKLDNVETMEAINDAFEVLPFVTALGEAVAETEDYYKQQKLYGNLTANYNQVNERIEAIKRAAEATNNKELMQAAINVQNELQDRVVDKWKTTKNTITEFSDQVVEKESKAIVSFALDKCVDAAGSPILIILSALGTGADLALHWDESYQAAMELEMLGMMNSDIKSSIPYIYQSDMDAAYNMNCLFNELQKQGFDKTAEFLKAYEEANLLSIKEFGYKADKNTWGAAAEDNYRSLFNDIEKQKGKAVEAQERLDNLYNAEWANAGTSSANTTNQKGTTTSNAADQKGTSTSNAFTRTEALFLTDRNLSLVTINVTISFNPAQGNFTVSVGALPSGFTVKSIMKKEAGDSIDTKKEYQSPAAFNAFNKQGTVCFIITFSKGGSEYSKTTQTYPFSKN